MVPGQPGVGETGKEEDRLNRSLQAWVDKAILAADVDDLNRAAF
jgi:hypothetical protein